MGDELAVLDALQRDRVETEVTLVGERDRMTQ